MTEFNDQYPNFLDIWDFSNPKQTEDKFKKLQSQISKEDNRSYYLQLVTQIARTKGLQQEFETGHEILTEVEGEFDSTDASVQIRYYLEKGRLYNSNNQKEKASPFFSKAWELGQKERLDYLAVDAAHMIAIVKDDPDEQLLWNQKAIAYTEASDDTEAKKWLGSLYNNTAWSYMDKGEYEEALKLFEKALDFRKANGEIMNTRIAKWAVARAHRSLKNYDLAIKMQLELLDDYKSTDDEPAGYGHEELGELYLVTGKDVLSKQYFKEAYTRLSRIHWLQSSEPERLERIKQLSE